MDYIDNGEISCWAGWVIKLMCTCTRRTATTHGETRLYLPRSKSYNAAKFQHNTTFDYQWQYVSLNKYIWCLYEAAVAKRYKQQLFHLRVHKHTHKAGSILDLSRLYDSENAKKNTHTHTTKKSNRRERLTGRVPCLSTVPPARIREITSSPRSPCCTVKPCRG